MIENRILKVISYIVIPFLILGIIIPILYYSIGNNTEDFSKEYYQTEGFSHGYINFLENRKRSVVDVFYKQCDNNIIDGEKNIYYIDNFIVAPYARVKEVYYLVSYGNEVWTNVQLTSETDTYDKILKYISERQDERIKYVNIVNNNIDTNSEAISLYGIKSINNYKDNKYFVYKYPDRVDFKEEFKEYYASNITVIEENSILEGDITNHEENTTNTEINNAIPLQLIENLKKEYPDIKIYQDSEYERLVFEFDSQKFNIYSSYVEGYDGEEIVENLRQKLQMLAKDEQKLSVIFPVCSGLLVIVCVYLLISIGHTKGKDEIDLNDLDKIPLEIILFVLCFLMIPIIFCIEQEFFYENYKLFINLITGMYFTYYILFAVVGNTIVKRIKVKCFWKTTFTGKICYFLIKKLKEIYTSMKKVINDIIDSWNITSKVMLSVAIYIIVAIIVIGIFGISGIILDFIFALYIMYKVSLVLFDYQKIEKHLNKMYNGEDVEKLDETKFSKYFKNTIEYINNIQNGYVNAIEEGIKSEKLKTELITNVSHDIKTPLTSIINYVDLLKQDGIDSEKSKEYLSILDNKSQRLKKLTEDLVEASKASSGNVRLKIEKINVKELIKQSLGEFEDKFNDKKLIIEENYPSKTVYINADNRYIYRVIENLFGNIAKYALDSTRVYIDVSCENKKLSISIKNISKDKLNISEDKLIQRFVRGDKSRTTEGSGLGLSISQSLTELQKGVFKIKIDGDLFKVNLSFDEA